MAEIDFLLLFECILNFAAEIVRNLASEKILQLHHARSLKDFLKKTKHHLYHQWDKKNHVCCNCPNTGRLIGKTGNLNTNIFEKLFANVKTNACSNGPRRRNGVAFLEACICKYDEKHISMKDLDLCDIKSLCRNSPLPSLFTTSEESHLDNLLDIRNKVCHAVKTNIFTEPDLDLMWNKVSDALCNLSNIDKKYMKIIIEDKRQQSLKATIIQELLSKIDMILKDAQNCTDFMRTQIGQNKTLDDIRKAQERQEDQSIKNHGEIIQEIGSLKAILSASTSTGTCSATQGLPLENADSGKEIDLKLKLKNIDEDKMRNGLEKEISSDINDVWIWVAVKQGCILLQMKTMSDTFSSEKILRSRVQALVNRILRAGEVNISNQAEIKLEFNIRSPVTTEEEKNIKNVFAESSELYCDFEKKISDEHSMKGKTEAFQDIQDAKRKIGETKEMDTLQLLQKDNEENVECPKCLYNFECAHCISKQKTVQKLRSELTNDSMQIQQIKGMLQGLNSAKYISPASELEQTEQSTEDTPCDICGFTDENDGDEMVFCEKCNVLVHQRCYYIPVVPDDDWFCKPCLEGVQPTCVLCNHSKGAMVKTRDGKQWVHVQCVWWLPGIKFEDEEKLEKIKSLDKIPKSRWKLNCCLCEKQVGACIQCCVKGCYKSFHSRCGFEKQLRMETIYEPELKFIAYCEEHSKPKVAQTKNVKGQGKRGRPRKRLISEESRMRRSESQKKKRKVGAKGTPEISLEHITSKNDQGDTCLHVAALKRDFKQIRHLLDRISKASLIQNCIDIQNKKCRTPLFISVLNNDLDIVEIFLKHGANPNIFAEAAEGKQGQRDAAIHVAASGGSSYLKTLEALLTDESISLNSFNNKGYTALHLAVKEHGREISKKEHIDSDCIIEKLIDAGIDPNLQDKNSGKTPLMYAIEKLDVTLVERFVRLIDPKKMRQLLKSESFDGQNVYSIIEELKDSFAKNNYKKLTDLLRNINEDPLSIVSSAAS